MCDRAVEGSALWKAVVGTDITAGGVTKGWPTNELPAETRRGSVLLDQFCEHYC